MQISQTFGKNLLVQSHQFAGEKILTGKTLSPGTLFTIKIHGMNLLELMFPFIDTLHRLQFFLTEKIFQLSKILTGKTLSPGTLLTIKIHGMNLLELMFPFIDTLHRLQFFLTEKILFQAQLHNYSFSYTDTVTAVKK